MCNSFLREYFGVASEKSVDKSGSVSDHNGHVMNSHNSKIYPRVKSVFSN